MYFLCKNEYRILKPIEITISRDKGRKKKNRGDERIRVIIHTYVEMSQKNSLHSYLKQTKCLFFSPKQNGGWPKQSMHM
jgi:hypothetical protein